MWLSSAVSYIDQLDASKQMDIIYLDMRKDFNKVDHAKLLGRLHHYGITSKLHDWFRSYLKGRKQQVTVLRATFWKPVTSGVQQWSLLGSVLFLRVACYANDTKIFKSIDSIMDCNASQSEPRSVDLNHLDSYLISPSVNTSTSPSKEHLYSTPIPLKYLCNLVTQRKTLVCRCQAFDTATREVLKIKELADTLLFLICQWISRQISRKTVDSTYPINSFKEEGFSWKTSPRFYLLKIFKLLTHSQRDMSTQKAASQWNDRTTVFTVCKMELPGKKKTKTSASF